MKIMTDRFGEFIVDDNKIVTFPYGMIGFENIREFIILEIDPYKPIYWLHSIKNKSLYFPAIIPFEFYMGYSVDITDSDISELKIDSPKHVLLMNIVNIPEDKSKMTVNLVSPIIINVMCGLGKQITLTNQPRENFSIYKIYQRLQNRKI
jgi:flagellar assembly factor FliW